MGLLETVAARLARGETVRFRPSGSSMEPIIRSRQPVTVAPVDPKRLAVDDIVLAKVAGTIYLHKITAIAGDRIQIGNNRGRINGWTSPNRVFGICVAIDGQPRRAAEAKTATRDPCAPTTSEHAKT